jgi:hypothetical protein
MPGSTSECELKPYLQLAGFVIITVYSMALSSRG